VRRRVSVQFGTIVPETQMAAAREQIGATNSAVIADWPHAKDEILRDYSIEAAGSLRGGTFPDKGQSMAADRVAQRDVATPRAKLFLVRFAQIWGASWIGSSGY
jgi:hypothetical protein